MAAFLVTVVTVRADNMPSKGLTMARQIDALQLDIVALLGQAVRVVRYVHGEEVLDL